MNTRIVKVNDVDLEVVEAGAGNPDRLLLVHGFGDEAGIREPVGRRLPAGG